MASDEQSNGVVTFRGLGLGAESTPGQIVQGSAVLHRVQPAQDGELAARYYGADWMNDSRPNTTLSELGLPQLSETELGMTEPFREQPLTLHFSSQPYDARVFVVDHEERVVYLVDSVPDPRQQGQDYPEQVYVLRELPMLGWDEALSLPAAVAATPAHE